MNAVTLQCLPSSEPGARRLSALLGIPCHAIEQHCFPDGEMRVTVGPASATTILYGTLDRPNDKLLAILFAVEALRRGGATRIVLVAPYLCYMRQDAAFRPGEAISQRVIGGLLAAAVDHVITVDAHLHRTADIQAVFPGIGAQNLSAMPVIASALGASGLDPATVVVGPDAESQPWVSNLAGRLGLMHTVARKSRAGDRSVDIALVAPALLAGRPALLADDIVSTGGTLIACAQALKAAGATTIDAVVTHALFPDDQIAEFGRAGIRSIRSTDSVAHATNAIALDDLLAAALRRELAGAERKEKTTWA